MLDNLAIISRVIEEHHAIRGHIKLVGDRLADREALTSLEKTRADLIPGRSKVLSEEQEKLQQALSLVDEGLENHFAFEEKALPPLLGELLMQALVLEHRNIQSEIGKAKSVVANTRLEGLSREELLSKGFYLHQVVGSICQLVEGHASKEEAILGMIQRALKEKETKKERRPF